MGITSHPASPTAAPVKAETFHIAMGGWTRVAASIAATNRLDIRA